VSTPPAARSARGILYCAERICGEDPGNVNDQKSVLPSDEGEVTARPLRDLLHWDEIDYGLDRQGDEGLGLA
jgi:hypothetical protein